MAEPGNGLNHVTTIRQELEVLVIIANRWVTQLFIVELRRASSGDFEVRFREICLHAGKPVSLTPRRQGAKETVEILEWVARRGRRADGEVPGRRIPKAGC